MSGWFCCARNIVLYCYIDYITHLACLQFLCNILNLLWLCVQYINLYCITRHTEVGLGPQLTHGFSCMLVTVLSGTCAAAIVLLSGTRAAIVLIVK